ncbi:MAG TPA: MBOAT family O-acyltransferase [Polyangiales bacterium]
MTEFWRRWHISLSSWLRDYLYVPLGGNRKGVRRTYVNLMTVMLLGGLWHGASWNFVIWGGIHGSALAFERAQGKDSIYRRLPAPLQIALTFLIVCLSWVFFRAKTLEQAIQYLGSMFGSSPITAASDAVAGALYTPYYQMMFAIAAGVVFFLPTTWVFTSRLSLVRSTAAVAAFALSVLLMWTQTVNPFLYFQF